MSGRLLFVTRKFPPSVGGMETLAAGIWHSLNRTTTDALLIAHSGGNKALPRWLPCALAGVVKLLARRRAEFVLAGDALMYTILFPLLKLFRARNATMVMGLDLVYGNPLYRAVIGWVLRRAPRVIAISAATAEAARSLDIPPERVGVVRLGVSSPEVTSDDRAAAAKEIRHRYDLPDDAVVILTLGRLVRRKGVRWFVQHVLPELATKVVYVIAGDGPERQAIRAAATAAGVGGSVCIVGRVDDATRELLLRGADVFVQPNICVPGDMEGFGLVTLEAAMRGTPTVASGIEGILDAVVDGETGILLPAEDSGAWVDLLRELTADTAGLSATGARFQLRARELYGEDEMARQLMAELAKC